MRLPVQQEQDEPPSTGVYRLSVTSMGRWSLVRDARFVVVVVVVVVHAVVRLVGESVEVLGRVFLGQGERRVYVAPGAANEGLSPNERGRDQGFHFELADPPDGVFGKADESWWAVMGVFVCFLSCLSTLEGPHAANDRGGPCLLDGGAECLGT